MALLMFSKTMQPTLITNCQTILHTMPSLQFVVIVKIPSHWWVIYNRPILLFCKHALSPGGKRGSMVCTSHLTCKQWYNKTREETDMNLINAYCFAFVGHSFCDRQWWYGQWCYEHYTTSRQSTMSTCTYYIVASIMASDFIHCV